MKPIRIQVLACILLSLFCADRSQAGGSALDLDMRNVEVGRLESWSLDDAVYHADFAAIVRLIDQGQECPGSMGRKSYDRAEVEVLHKIWGTAESRFKAHYRVLMSENAKGKQPPQGTVMIVIGNFDRDELDMKRYIYPTPKNLASVGSLIRKFHGKELAKDPAASAQLEKALALPLDEYQPKPQPPPVPAPEMPKPSTANVKQWGMWAALVVLLVALWAWRKTKKTSC